MSDVDFLAVRQTLRLSKHFSLSRSRRSRRSRILRREMPTTGEQIIYMAADDGQNHPPFV